MPDLFGGRRPAGLMPPPGLGPRINRRHPLAKGLVGLWFPAGGSLILDLTGNMAPLTASGTPSGVGPAGYQARDTSTGPSYWSTTNVPAVQKPTAEFSLLYLGQYLGMQATSSQNMTIFGIGTTTGVNPYTCCEFFWNGAGSPHSPGLAWNYSSAHNQVSSSLAASATGQPYILVATVILGGPYALWSNGALGTSGSAAAGAVYYGTSGLYIGGGGSGNTSNAGFGFSLGGLWNRALTAAEAQSLSADPWQVLEWPFDRIPRSLTSVNLTLLLDRVAPAEFQTGVLEPGSLDVSPYLDTGDGSWLDTGDGSYLDAGISAPAPWAPIEIAGNVEMGPSDILLPLEGGLAARRDMQAPIEDLAGGVALAGDSETPIEVQASAAAERAVVAESLALHRVDIEPATESTALSQPPAPAPAESGESVALDRRMPSEATGSVAGHSEPPIEVQASAAAERAVAAESAALYRGDIEPPTEQTALSRPDAPAPNESGESMALDRRMPWEAAGNVSTDTATAAEWLGQPPVVVLNADWVEFLASTRADPSAAAASAANFVSDTLPPTETLGRTPLIALTSDWFEWLASQRADGMPVEWPANFRADAAAPSESSARQSADAPSPLAALLTAARDGALIELAAVGRGEVPAVAEWLTGARADLPGAAESTTGARRDAAAPVEALGTATREELPVEWLAVVPRDADAAAEWAALFSAAPIGDVEWAALSASDRAAVVEWIRTQIADPLANSFAPIEFGQTNPPPLFLVERRRLRTVPATGRVRGEGPAVLPPTGARAAPASGGTVSFAASAPLPAAESGWSFDNAGATAPIVFSLPPWAPNLVFTVLVVAPEIVTVAAWGSDQIAIGGNLAGSISSGQPYSAVTLRTGNAAGVWIETSMSGDWDA